MSINRFNFRAFIKPYNKIYKVQSLENDGTFMAVKCFEEDGKTILKRNDNITNLPLFTEGEFDLMQSTGLTDKNGKEIFEGYILEHPFIGKFFIKYSNISKRFTLIINDIKEGYEDCCGDFTWDDFVGMENKSLILGNIYENPELLKS